MPSKPDAAASWRKVSIQRRDVLVKAVTTLAAVGVAALAATPAHAAKKKKGKAAKEEFFYQETPGEQGRTCGTCANYEPVGGGEKGSCALVEGEVCKTCYCQGWSDKAKATKPAA